MRWFSTKTRGTPTPSTAARLARKHKTTDTRGSAWRRELRGSKQRPRPEEWRLVFRGGMLGGGGVWIQRHQDQPRRFSSCCLCSASRFRVNSSQPERGSYYDAAGRKTLGRKVREFPGGTHHHSNAACTGGWRVTEAGGSVRVQAGRSNSWMTGEGGGGESGGSR